MGQFLSGQRNIQSITMKYSIAGHTLYACRKLTVCIVIWKKSCLLVNISLQYHFTVRVLPVLHSSIQYQYSMDHFRQYQPSDVLSVHSRWSSPHPTTNQPLLSWCSRLWRWNEIWWADQHPVSSAKSLIARAHPPTSKRKRRESAKEKKKWRYL